MTSKISIAVVAILGLAAFIFLRPSPPFASGPKVVEGPTYFAEIGDGDVVLRVIVISQEQLNTGRWGDPARWVQTWTDGGPRKNYAGPGLKYDKERNAFIGKKPKNATGFDEDTAQWIVPTP